MKITSPVFKNNELVPPKYTCSGFDINPPLEISDVPKEAKSLALIVEDPNAAVGTWLHWIIWNIKPETTLIEENSLPPEAVEGMTDFGSAGYGGPCPPAGTHHYYFKLYALDKKLDLKKNSSRDDLEKAISGHVVDSAELIGLYKRHQNI